MSISSSPRRRRVHLFHDGQFIGPFVYGFDYHLDLKNLKRDYTSDPGKIQPLRFFCHGDPYKFWGLDRRAICIWSARPRAAPPSCWAPTGSAATC